MIGGAGNDTYVVDVAGDVVTELAGQGTDTVQSSVSYTLGANVENLHADRHRRHQRHRQHARQHAHRQRRRQRARRRRRHRHDDRRRRQRHLRRRQRRRRRHRSWPASGTDTVQSSVTYTLGANVENLTLTGTADDQRHRQRARQHPDRQRRQQLLDGGAGADTMTGGARQRHLRRRRRRRRGHRSWPAQGTDTVQSSISYTLGANVENLTLTGTGRDQRHRQTLDNTLTGNAGDNVLDGGAGNDTMARRCRRRQRHLRRRRRRRRRHRSWPAQGTDTVQSSVSYTLGANVENLTLTGTAAINATGNTLDNMLTGNSRQQRAHRRRRQRHRWHGGGAGNDTYVVDAAGDVVTELAGRAPTPCRAASATRSAPMSRT